jgi:hypothetical protein
MFALGADLLEGRSGRSSAATGTSREERQAAIDQAMAETVAGVETGYAAFYREANGSPEIGVYAVRLKTPLTNAEAQQWLAAVQGVGSSQRLRVVKETIAIAAWSDARADRPDRLLAGRATSSRERRDQVSSPVDRHPCQPRVLILVTCP